MTTYRFLVIASASWMVLAAAGTTGWCAVTAWWRRDRVNRMTELPPVPEPDANWLSVWPSGAHLIDFDAVHELLSEPMEQQQYDRIFCDIVAIEGWQ